MLAKSVIAGTVLSLMAGGVVYFGTDVNTASVKETVAQKAAEIKAEVSDKVMAGGEEAHPHSKKAEPAKVEKPESSTDIKSVKTASGKVIEAKKPVISSSSDVDDKQVKTAEASPSEKPQKKWLNQYLKKDTPAEASDTDKAETNTAMTKSTEVTEDEAEQADVAKDLMQSMGLTKDGASESDTGRFVVEDETKELTEKQIQMAEAEGFEERALETENIWVEEKSSEKEPKSSTRKMLHDIIKKDSAPSSDKAEKSETTIETETLDMGDGKVMKIVKKTIKTEDSHNTDSKKIHIKVMTDKDGKGSLDADDIKIIRMGEDITIDELMKEAKSKDISGTVKVVMEQAAKIEMPELRDRAYLDLVSYGLKNGNYKVASKALKKIEQVELRDTARNRIAVAHAKDGNAEDAFAILDYIEVEALRDVMRLQVIEAMIAPDALPEDMQ